jgi:hypothetical protein
MTLLSVSNVLIALDNGDGTERPYEFSARTMNMYDVAGFKSLIYSKRENEKTVRKIHLRTQIKLRGGEGEPLEI